ncbi:TPA: lytic transglycosylase domain-containing protein [Salmonella enterica subsp. enterica serovar Bahrenfeld]|nr:lytic transglycosylase domain-containing protein [Salmonella enterica]HAR9009716.1 lytic transglycosylase domain-containing protein [Salmonella enterica]HAR9317397.1 lytic transglycosylase domain-containing protein [Salmonella enterica]
MIDITSEIQDCVHDSAQRYHLPEKLILAVINVEGGRNGLVSHNENGTVDLGIMQINSIHINELKGTGIKYNDILYKACTNIDVGTWLLRKKFSEKKDYRESDNWWQAVGNYHSKTPKFNHLYQTKVWAQVLKLKER